MKTTIYTFQTKLIWEYKQNVQQQPINRSREEYNASFSSASIQLIGVTTQVALK